MKHLLLFLLLIFCSFSYSQSLNFIFKGTVENADNGKNEGGVTVSVVQNGSTLASTTTGSNGKYTLKANINYKRNYSVVFSKPGMVSKRANFNLTTMNEEDIPPGAEYQPVGDLSMSLFADRPNIDFSFLNTEPVATFNWDNSRLMPELDRDASEKTRKKIEKLLNDAERQKAENEIKYQAAIKEADNLYKNKDYKGALAKYEEALTYKPKEPHPTARIVELDALIQAQKKEELIKNQADAEYNNLIKAADGLRDQKKYDLAISKYEEALTKKNEQYPKDQIIAIKKLVEQQKKDAENEAKYKEAVAQADGFFNQKSYMAAKDKYKLANSLKPTEQHPINRLAEIEKKLEEQNAEKEKKRKYDEAITAADALFASEKYEEAKAKYNEALKIETAATYPIAKIKECDTKLLEKAKQKEKEEKIQKLISEGNTLMQSAKWSEAKAKFIEVQTLDPQNAVAKQKIDEINKKIEEANNLAAQEAKFNKLVADGDLASKGAKYTDAKTKYEEALAIKKDASVEQKLADVQKKIKEIADKEAQEQKFQALKTEGMKLAQEQQWLDAKSKLTEASAIKQDPAITQKLKEIDEKIKANQALMQLEAEYKTLMDAAATLENANNIDGAIAKYKEASLKKPAEQLPKDRIAALEAKKADAGKQKEIDAKYAAFMKKGDEMMAQKNYLAAIKEYNQALALKPTEKEPVDKAAEAERLEKARSSEGDQAYEKLLTVAQSKIDERDFPKAKELLERAIKIKAVDSRPKEMLKQVEFLEKQEKEFKMKMDEAEVRAGAKEYQKAVTLVEQALIIKPGDKNAEEKLEKYKKLVADQSSLAEKETLYKDYMTKGGLSKNAKNYEQALMHYQNALSLKPGDAAAIEKIAEIQKILDDIANANKNEIDRKNQFDALVLEADREFATNNYSQAESLYKKALVLDNGSSYVKKQIEECNRLLKLKDINTSEAEYNKVIEEANEYFALRSYDKARSKYEKALTIKPNEEYPSTKLKEIDAILNPVIVQAGALENLGVPYEENSIMDGHAALVKAELERKNLKNTKVKRKVDKISEAESDLTQKKTQEQLETNNEIYRVQQSITVSTQNSDLNRQELVEVLRKAEKELAEEKAQNDQFKHADNIRSQETMNAVVEQSTLDYSVREAVYSSNTSILHNYTSNMAEDLRKQHETEAIKNVVTDQKLMVVQNNLQKEAVDNYEERKITEREVNNAITSASNKEKSLTNQNETELLLTKANIALVDASVANKAVNDSKYAPQNKETLKIVQGTVVATEEAKTNQRDISSKEISAKIDQVNISVSESDVDRDLNRLKTTDIIHEGNKNIQLAAHEAYQNETLKYLQTENEIKRQAEKNNGVNDLADAKHAKNVTAVDLVDKKASMIDVENSLTDEEQRLRTKAKVEIQKDNAQENLRTTTEKQEVNSAKMEDVNRAMDAGKTNAQNAQKEKSLDAQTKLSNIDSKQPEKVKLANSLGQEYPEGVSQESFVQNDENGLMKAVITRRIVVINGHGNVYVRTQTLQSITYTKNGAPSTEFVWQKETQGPNLVKNY